MSYDLKFAFWPTLSLGRRPLPKPRREEDDPDPRDDEDILEPLRKTSTSEPTR